MHLNLQALFYKKEVFWIGYIFYFLCFCWRFDYTAWVGYITCICWQNRLNGFDFSVFPTTRSDMMRYLGIDLSTLTKLLCVYLLALTRLLYVDFLAFTKLFYINLLAFAGLHTFFFIIVIFISSGESLERRYILIVGGQVGSGFAFIIFRNSKIIYPNNFILFFNMHPINCVTIIANQSSFQSFWRPLFPF